MSAAATILELLDVNSHIIVIDNLYGGNQYLFDTIRKKTAGLSCSYIDMTDISLIQSAVRENTRMIWVESPTNPLLQIVDLSAIVKIGRDNNILTVMDNTLATPFLQRPLEFGFDIVLHSATKYLNGHSDIINGAVIIGDNDILAEKLLNLQIGLGAIPSPFDCYSVMRGIKTLAVRMERHCENALELAQWLEKHPCIDKVYYPGLSSHPQHKLAAQQMFLYGGVISVLIKGGIEQVKRFVTSCELFTFTSSLGGTESTMAHPATMSHSLLSKNRRTQLGILDNLIRLSVGIEDIEDLKSDLEIHLREA